MNPKTIRVYRLLRTMIPKIHTTIILLALCFAPGGAAVAQTQVPQANEEQQRRSSVRDAYQGAWSAAPERKDKEMEPDPGLFDLTARPAEQLDVLRSTRNEALSRNQGVLANSDRAALRQQADQLNAAYPNSFEGHLARYYAAFPAPSSYAHLDLAKTMDPDRAELVAPLLTQAIREDDRVALARAARDMKARGDVAPALYTVAGDILLSVDRDGILIAAGEMDGFPLAVSQYAENKRTDVLVIDRRLLEDPVYRSRMWNRAKARGDVPGDANAFLSRLHVSCDRPVFLSLALGGSVAAGYTGLLHVTGMAMRMTNMPCCTIKQLESNWKAMRKTTDAGPIGRNYVIPAALLLKHYRTEGDEKKASEMEHELRGMAERMGLTNELIANGILQH